MKATGTIVKVRDIHKNNEDHRKKFFVALNTSHDSTLEFLHSYSLILINRTLKISYSYKPDDNIENVSIKPVWTTENGESFMDNVQKVLRLQYRNTYPNMNESVIEWEKEFYPDMIKIRCIMLRPGNFKNTLLVKKCLHIFLNGRPAAATQRFHAVFYDLYRDFKIPPQTIPFAVVDITANE